MLLPRFWSIGNANISFTILIRFRYRMMIIFFRCKHPIFRGETCSTKSPSVTPKPSRIRRLVRNFLRAYEEESPCVCVMILKIHRPTMSGEVTAAAASPRSSINPCPAKKPDQYIKISYWKWLRAARRQERQGGGSILLFLIKLFFFQLYYSPELLYFPPSAVGKVY